MTCSHAWRWDLKPHNESGWLCFLCDHKPGEPAGYSPQLDRSETVCKVECILLMMADYNLVSVSNSDHGDAICAMVADRCHRTGRFDQESIVSFLADECSGGGKYWRELGTSIMVGNDTRPRCDCGQLSTVSQGTKRWCSECCVYRSQEYPF